MARRKPIPANDIPRAPWDRKPVGYDIKPRGRGWIAFLVREGDDELGGSFIPLASGRSQSGVRRRAEREVRRELATFEHEHVATTERVYVVSSPRDGIEVR